MLFIIQISTDSIQNNSILTASQFFHVFSQFLHIFLFPKFASKLLEPSLDIMFRINFRSFLYCCAGLKEYFIFCLAKHNESRVILEPRLPFEWFHTFWFYAEEFLSGFGLYDDIVDVFADRITMNQIATVGLH